MASAPESESYLRDLDFLSPDVTGLSPVIKGLHSDRISVGRGSEGATVFGGIGSEWEPLEDFLNHPLFLRSFGINQHGPYLYTNDSIFQKSTRERRILSLHPGSGDDKYVQEIEVDRGNHQLFAYQNTHHILDHEDRRDELLAGVLTHDVSHPPFSHPLEDLLATGDHEDLYEEMIRNTGLSEVMNKYGIDVGEVVGLVTAGKSYNLLNQGDHRTDIDRLSYTCWDALNLGPLFRTDGRKVERKINSNVDLRLGEPDFEHPTDVESIYEQLKPFLFEENDEIPGIYWSLPAAPTLESFNPSKMSEIMDEVIAVNPDPEADDEALLDGDLEEQREIGRELAFKTPYNAKLFGMLISECNRELYSDPVLRALDSFNSLLVEEAFDEEYITNYLSTAWDSDIRRALSENQESFRDTSYEIREVYSLLRNADKSWIRESGANEADLWVQTNGKYVDPLISIEGQLEANLNLEKDQIRLSTLEELAEEDQEIYRGVPVYARNIHYRDWIEMERERPETFPVKIVGDEIKEIFEPLLNND